MKIRMRVQFIESYKIITPEQEGGGGGGELLLSVQFLMLEGVTFPISLNLQIVSKHII